MPAPAGLSYGTLDTRVELMLTRLRPFALRAVMSRSGQTYLYHHIRCSMDFVASPSATVPPPFLRDHRHPRVNTGLWAKESIPYLRYLLLRPRQKLLITRGDTVLLESPQRTIGGQEMPCDANGGPVPISCDFHTFIGDKTALGTYVIETWISYSRGGANGQVPTVLAHEWDVSSRLDGDTYLTTRTIQGNIVLRRDLMEIRRIGNTVGLRPQDFVPSLFHPPVDGYRRTGVDVRYSSDGTSLDYTIVDEQQTWGVLANRGIIKIEGWQEQTVDWLQLGLPTAGSVVHLEAFGYPHCTTQQLLIVLASVYSSMRNPLGQPAVGIERVWFQEQNRNLRPGLAEAVQVHVDLPRRHASLTVRRSTTGVPLGGAVLAGGAIFQQFGGAADPIHFAEDFGVMGGRTTLINPAPAFNGSTGDPLLSLVTQALTNPGVEPTRPAFLNTRPPATTTVIPG